jgi:Bacterial nucleoid DNA-binding protein
MNKQDIIHELTYQTGIQHEAVQLVIESAALLVRDAIIRGDRVVIAGFGSFTPTVRKAKTAQDIRRGKAIQLPARRGVKFRPSKFIKSALDQPIQTE